MYEIIAAQGKRSLQSYDSYIYRYTAYRINMKSLSFLFLLFISSQLTAQGTSNFEIWGWEGKKEHFVKLYADSIGTNLNHGYTCIADLKKMGYEHSISQLWVENIEDYLSGNINWDSTERLAIIRQIPMEKYTKLSVRKTDKVEKAMMYLLGKDSTSTIQQLEVNHRLKKLIFLGTLSQNPKIRINCFKIFSRYDTQPISTSKNDMKILAEMLSFPDPSTTYLAINVIENAEIPEEENATLFSMNALTISDFLDSELRSFKSDAVEFLKLRFPNEKATSSKEWQKLIGSIK